MNIYIRVCVCSKMSACVRENSRVGSPRSLAVSPSPIVSGRSITASLPRCGCGCVTKHNDKEQALTESERKRDSKGVEHRRLTKERGEVTASDGGGTRSTSACWPRASPLSVSSCLRLPITAWLAFFVSKEAVAGPFGAPLYRSLPLSSLHPACRLPPVHPPPPPLSPFAVVALCPARPPRTHTHKAQIYIYIYIYIYLVTHPPAVQHDSHIFSPCNRRHAVPLPPSPPHPTPPSRTHTHTRPSTEPDKGGARSKRDTGATMNFLGGSLRGGGSHRRDKGFSAKNKVQQYHGDGSESIIVMGRPFRVLQKISDVPPPYMVGRQRSSKYGEGGSSYVYLVENSNHLPEFPRHMALKRSFFGVDQVTEAHKEVEIVSRIQDKNIARVFHSEISRNEGRLGVSIAMEYCSNNLYRRIRNSTGTGSGIRLTEAEICHVMFAVTSAVGYLHTQQPPITHRDIRPENILIDNKQAGPTAYKLTNFSNATTEAYQCETREEANMAISDIQMHTSPAFRAPEMVDPWSKKRICEKADMWSIGVLLYYMMYLCLPFSPSSTIGKENWVITFPSQTMSSYTPSLRVIVEHLLNPDPSARWDIFALTNYMRFDEDCSRHLGTFCFTKTEWPEGWEEQDVKVLGRTPPPKASPVTYKEPGHEQLDGCDASRHEGVYSHKNGHQPLDGRGSGSGLAADSDAVKEAMIVLGGDPADDDPDVAAYRNQIIMEQEEAWRRAKASAGLRDPSPTEPHESGAAPPPTAPQNEAKKKDVFDDLFASASPDVFPASQAPPVTSSSVPPAIHQPPEKDVFNTSDLFSNLAPPPNPSYPMMNTYGQAPQQDMTMGGWGSVAPVMSSGGYPVQQTQNQQPAPWGYGVSNANNYAPPPPPPQQFTNFMAPVPGQQQGQLPEASQPPMAPATTKKDPFADLFN
ncbi:protein kinase, putative [Leishmania tarentolae]|uniref:non-specific serine/threonine protein kinase n=1 Tax=Leishmania tarentolae TaxID=5689 RepID=A0A640KCG7_LEITA|nr:protein kinase, putative [Leishmania tarentolae]